jgi:hypothetical protein
MKKYNLQTPWSLSSITEIIYDDGFATASMIAFSEDGTILLTMIYQDQQLERFNLSTPWETNGRLLDSQSTRNFDDSGVIFDENRLYIIDADNGVGALQKYYYLNWQNVTTTSSPVKAYESTNLTHGGDTTQQIGAGAYVVDNNGIPIIDPGGLAGPTSFLGSDEAEYEFTVEFDQALLTDQHTIIFRIAGMDTYTQPYAAATFSVLAGLSKALTSLANTTDNFSYTISRNVGGFFKFMIG